VNNWNALATTSTKAIKSKALRSLQARKAFTTPNNRDTNKYIIVEIN
jgi:hypothetical protein